MLNHVFYSNVPVIIYHSYLHLRTICLNIFTQLNSYDLFSSTYNISLCIRASDRYWTGH